MPDTDQSAVNDNEQELEKKRLSYDAAFKQFLEESSDENFIRFINGLCGKNLPTDLKVERLSTESNKETRRVADIYIRVGDSMYSFEIQTSNDHSMAVRVFEYGFRGALQHGQTTDDNGAITLRFPEPVVIYLRSNENTPMQLAVNVEFPHIGQTVKYTVPTKRMGDYTPAKLLEQYLLPLMPFYPMKYEHLLNNPEAVKQFSEETLAVCDIIRLLIENGQLRESEAAEMLDTLKLVYANVAESKNVEDSEEVENMISTMDTIEIIDYKATVAKAEARGEARGDAKVAAVEREKAVIAQEKAVIAQEKAALEQTTVMLLHKIGQSIEFIAENLHIDEEKVKSIIAGR
jgi:predicted transposase/invertase (TIGR01784 family)